MASSSIDVEVRIRRGWIVRLAGKAARSIERWSPWLATWLRTMALQHGVRVDTRVGHQPWRRQHFVERIEYTIERSDPTMATAGDMDP